MNAIKMGLTATLLIACLCVNSFAQERVVKIAGDDYPPWTNGKAGSKPEDGIAVELATELFSRMDLESTHFVYPFKRGMQRTMNGEDDVITMVSRSEERERYILFTSPIRYINIVFYYSAVADFDWNEWEDLQSYRIGTVSGYNFGKEWSGAVEKYNLKTEEVKSDSFNMEKLLAGRIDIFATDQEVMEQFILQNPKYHGKFKWHAKPIYETVNNFGISKKSFLAPLLPQINRVLKEMQEDGTFQSIYCAHGKAYRGICENS